MGGAAWTSGRRYDSGSTATLHTQLRGVGAVVAVALLSGCILLEQRIVAEDPHAVVVRFRGDSIEVSTSAGSREAFPIGVWRAEAIVDADDEHRHVFLPSGGGAGGEGKDDDREDHERGGSEPKLSGTGYSW